MKKTLLILTILTLFIVQSSNATAFCLFGIIGNTCDSGTEDFYPASTEQTPLGEVIPVESEIIDNAINETIINETIDDGINNGNSEIVTPIVSSEIKDNSLDITEDEKNEVDVVIEKVEGDLVNLNPVAVDPDGDEITYFYSEPLSPNGLWQTKRGDAGKYLVTVTATDGELNSSQEIMLLINPANKIPVLECPELIKVNEGNTISLDCNAYDPDGDSIVLSYNGWLNSNTKKTTYDDAGIYTVQVIASDGEDDTTAEISIEVMNINRAPKISELKDVLVTENDVVVINPEVVDPDGDKVTVEFSKPLDAEGIFKTKDGDSGTYTVTVTATDGILTSKKSFVLEVTDINTKPVVKRIPDIQVYETETIHINVEAYDPEGDEITVLFEGWMDSDTKKTTYDDAGTYVVTVTVSDGDLSTSQDVNVVIKNKNRAPTFIIPA